MTLDGRLVPELAVDPPAEHRRQRARQIAQEGQRQRGCCTAAGGRRRRGQGPDHPPLGQCQAQPRGAGGIAQFQRKAGRAAREGRMRGDHIRAWQIRGTLGPGRAERQRDARCACPALDHQPGPVQGHPVHLTQRLPGFVQQQHSG
jgi:hypothetical protein